jgi:hypothetical protein
MMIFAYALFVPAGVGLTSAFGSQLLASTLHVTIAPWALFIVVLTVAVFLAYLGITTSASVDLLLVAGEIAVIAALAITILVKIGPAHYSVAVLSPASSPNQRLTDLTDAMIYGFTAFAGFEAAAALGEEATNARRSVPVSIVGVVVVTGIFYLLVVCAEAFALGRHGIAGLIGQTSPLGYLTSRFWSPSVLWSIDLVIVLPGLSFVVASVNAAIRIMYTMGRERALPGSLGPAVTPPDPGGRDRMPRGDHAADRAAADVRLRRRAHVRVPGRDRRTAGRADLPRREHRGDPGVPHRVPRRVQARAASAHPGGRLGGLPVPSMGHPVPGCLHAGEPAALHFPRLALIGAIAVGILRARRPATFQALGGAVAPNLNKQLEPD